MTPVRLKPEAVRSRVKHSTTELLRSLTLFAYEKMIRFDPTLVDLTNNFFVPCANMKVYLYNYSKWVELSINIHEGKA